jgi:hypothetical protein
MTQHEIETFNQAREAWIKYEPHQWNLGLQRNFSLRVMKYALAAQITVSQAKEAVQRGKPIE